MKVYALDEGNLPAVAGLMARIKPEWWDERDALDQLADIRNTAFNVGWCMGEDEGRPKGWLLCVDYACYSCLSIECLGYDEDGAFVMEGQLQPLLEQAERYARAKGYRMLRYGISSIGLSCHGRPLGDYGRELMELRSNGRAHFDYFVSIGFRPAGFFPNCYGEHFHCVLMIKELRPEALGEQGAVD